MKQNPAPQIDINTKAEPLAATPAKLETLPIKAVPTPDPVTKHEERQEGAGKQMRVTAQPAQENPHASMHSAGITKEQKEVEPSPPCPASKEPSPPLQEPSPPVSALPVLAVPVTALPTVQVKSIHTKSLRI